MATVTLRRSDLFPVGTTVGIYPRGSGAPAGYDGPPRSAVLASAIVDAAGLLTVTDPAVLSGTDYNAYAKIGSEHRYARVRSTLDVHDYGRVVGTGDITSGSFTILNAAASSGSFQIGQVLSGPGIKPGTTINNIVGGTLAIDQAATATTIGVALQGEGGKRWVGRVKTRKALIGTT
jgi:hypothetical protein